MKNRNTVGQIIALILVLTSASIGKASPTPRHVSPSTMDKNTREVFDEAMQLDAMFYDETAKLIKSPNSRPNSQRANYYMVRESSWYALGLLVRDAPGDRQRAADILDAVLKQQYLKSGVRWYGTFRRSPQEPEPGPDAVMWRAYDPNWRVFIGTTFAIILIEYPNRISSELAQRMYTAIDHGIEGEIAEGRLLPSYSNISLMYGFLWDFAAAHDKRADWQKQSSDWTESVYKLYKQYGAFFEYNSPTYSGVDIYGLALWRDYGSSERIRSIGSEMEAGLWRNIADLYQPDLRNVSGPYDRAYGMDMESYVSVVGVWMRTAFDAQHAPLPKLTPTTDHLADIWFLPHIAVLGTRIPKDALAKMTKFEGEHLMRQQITDQRIATAWIGKKVMFGGESTTETKDEGTASQFHAATIQWRTPSGEIGFAYVIQAPMIDATADQHGLTISTNGTIRLRVHAKDMDQAKITQNQWDLPGLQVAVTSDAKSFSVEKAGEAVDLVYTGITGARLEIKPAP